jgi:uncharacterized protein YdhG (YjbR/CyaY superfamily)
MTTSHPTRTTGRSAGTTAAEASGTFSAEERAAMQDRATELKASTRRGAKASREDGERDLLTKVEAMDEPDRTLARQVHELISATAPELTPQTYYGMPAYAKDGKVLCFFKAGSKFKMRYSTLGFTDRAKLDDGDLWPSEFAVQRWSGEVAARVEALVRAAAR